jgi:hypothetical protein
MRRSTRFRCCALPFALALAACAAYQSQHGIIRAPATASPAVAAASAEAAAITPVPPGKEFTELPDGRQVAIVRGQTDEVKKNLAAKGRYACCVRPACNECLLKRGECHCREVATKGGPCCGECTEAWVEGRGAIEGLKAWDLLERRRQMLDRAPSPP